MMLVFLSINGHDVRCSPLSPNITCPFEIQSLSTRKSTPTSWERNLEPWSSSKQSSNDPSSSPFRTKKGWWYLKTVSPWVPISPSEPLIGKHIISQSWIVESNGPLWIDHQFFKWRIPTWPKSSQISLVLAQPSASSSTSDLTGQHLPSQLGMRKPSVTLEVANAVYPSLFAPGLPRLFNWLSCVVLSRNLLGITFQKG